MGVALVSDSFDHCLVRREPAWPETDAGGGGGEGLVCYFVVVQETNSLVVACLNVDLF